MMWFAIVKRQQYAVGHGGFHFGRLSLAQEQGSPRPIEFNWTASTLEHVNGLRTPADLHYVFDCGSEQSAALNKALILYQNECKGHIDILFVSHFDTDHLNGIDRLLRVARPKVVVVPYLSSYDLSLLLLSEAERGSLSSTLREYVKNPVQWWRRRGAANIVFLEPDDGTDPGSILPILPDGPTRDRDDPGEGPQRATRTGEFQASARLASHLEKPRNKVAGGLKAADSGLREKLKGAILAGRGSAFLLECKLGASFAWRYRDWILLPYVHPVNHEICEEFFSEIFRYLKIRQSSSRPIHQVLLDHLTSFKKLKDIIGIYSKYFGSNKNVISLSLYSGPYASMLDKNIQNANYWSHISSNNLFWPNIRYTNQPCGWLLTGDANLKSVPRLDPWYRFYSRLSHLIGIINLPHHGSKLSFNERVISFSGLKIALATTLEASGRVARLREVLECVQSAGKIPHVIDDVRLNSFEIISYHPLTDKDKL